MLYATASVCEGAVAVAVDLQRRERLDSLADALITHPEVPLRGDHAAVAHQLAQHLDRGVVAPASCLSHVLSTLPVYVQLNGWAVRL